MTIGAAEKCPARIRNEDTESPGDLGGIGIGLIARSEDLDILFVRPTPAFATPGDELNATMLAITMNGMMHCMMLAVAPSQSFQSAGLDQNRLPLP